MVGAVRAAYAVIAALSLAPLVFPVPVALQMTGLCLALIFVGSSNSLKLAHPADGEEAPPKLEAKEVYLFPVMGSAVLFSLYLVYKFLPPQYINILVKAYFFIFGIFVLGARISDIVSEFAPAAALEPLHKAKFSFRIPFWSVLRRFFEETPKKAAPASEKKDAPVAEEKESSEKSAAPAEPAAAEPEPEDPSVVSGTGLDAVGVAAALVIGVWYLASNHWLANNLFGMAFTLQALEWIHLEAYFHGFFLLAGLCVYDIFWVFGTEVMVTVAKSFDGPIKLLFPQPYLPHPSMLGLGDIVIPGIVISLMLKFDFQLFLEKSQSAAAAAVAASAERREELSKFVRAPRPYFHAALIAYTLGLLVTLFVMYYFKAAQPALLYLSPAGIISSLGTAAYRGELKKLWAFRTEKEEAEADTASDSKKDTKQD